MTVVLEQGATPLTRALPQSTPHDAAEALEDIIAAHRAALVALAPHQARRRVREETAWHITELGVLLRVRGTVHAAAEQQKAAPGMVPDRERPEESTGPDRRTR